MKSAAVEVALRHMLASRQAQARKIVTAPRERFLNPSTNRFGVAPLSICPGGYGCHCNATCSRGRPTVRVEWRHFEDGARTLATQSDRLIDAVDDMARSMVSR